MEVILQQDIPSLGDAGQVVKVKAGYARNYLLPQKMAVIADTGNMKTLEHQQRVVAAKQEQLRREAQGLADKIKGLVVSFTQESNEEGKLFGAVTSQDIAKALAEKGVDVDRRKFTQHEPIKAIGDYKMGVRLHREVEAQFTVKVESSNASAE